MIKVVAFDLDDTLWAVQPVLLRAERALDAWLAERLPEAPCSMASLRDLAPELLQAQPELRHRLTSLRTRLIELGLAKRGIPGPQAARLAGEAMAVFLAERNQVDFFDGALEAIAEIAPRYRLGALSNGNADIKRLGLAEHFSFSFSAEEVANPKPAPDLFHAALELTGIQPEEMAYVGDDPIKDVDAAKQVGLRTVWLRNRLRPGPGKSLPDQTLDAIGQLPAALRALDGS